MDLMTMIFNSHAVYFYLIDNYANPPALQKEIWWVFLALYCGRRHSPHHIPGIPGAHKYVFTLHGAVKSTDPEIRRTRLSYLSR